jgi:acyl-CoA dehydrogenase
VAAGHALPLPLGETLLAAWLLCEAGIAPPAGPLGVAPVMSGDRFSEDAAGRIDGAARRVSFASEAEHLALLVESGDALKVALVARADAGLSAGRTLAGEPCSDVSLQAVRPISLSPSQPGALAGRLRRMGALLRAQQMAGALERILEQSLDYAGTREQFGRPIARFQAVQHNLAVLAAEVAAAATAADAAVLAVQRHGLDHEHAFFAIASAKIRAGQAAGAGAAIAHQVHGAMGFTRDYPLQQRTRRLWAWRDEFGAETTWAIELGRRVAAAGAAAVWPTVTAV